MQIVGPGNVRQDLPALITHSYDAYFVRGLPAVVVEPDTAERVSEVVKTLVQTGAAFVVRGAATGYAGGVIPCNGEVVVSTRRLNAIRGFDPAAGWIEVEAGVVTHRIKEVAAAHELHYPPDPSSYSSSTIGGNLATNAGGPHCLGYGVTSNYVMELECVTAEGKLVRLGSSAINLAGLLVGSEGTLAVITAARLRLVDQPQCKRTIIASFDKNESAIGALVALFEQGRNPIALDMISRVHHPDGYRFRFRNDAMLFIETEGSAETVSHETNMMKRALFDHGAQAEVFSKNDYMRQRFTRTRERWTGVMAETGLTGYFLFDSVVRRQDLGRAASRLKTLSERFGFVLANTFHAGDGNIHPTPFFDRHDPDHSQRLDAFRKAVQLEVREMGGLPSGEHGIGIEKSDILPSFLPTGVFPCMTRIKLGMDPDNRLNPGKVLDPCQPEKPVVAPGAFEADLRRSQCEKVVIIESVIGYVIAPGNATLAKIEDALADALFCVPYIAACGPADVTLDELVRVGTPSLLDWRHGDPCHLVLGALLKRAPAESIVIGSPFQKDVAGYGLRRLLFGSGSAFGTLDAVAFRLVPRPSLRQMLLVERRKGAPGPRSLPAGLRAVMAGYLAQTNRKPPSEILVLEGFASELDLALNELHAEAPSARIADLVQADLAQILPKRTTERYTPSDGTVKRLQRLVVQAMGNIDAQRPKPRS